MYDLYKKDFDIKYRNIYTVTCISDYRRGPGW
jgi:hypothetical protein